MRNMIARFVTKEDGATAIEYGLLASLIALAIIAALLALGPKLATTFSSVTSNL